MWINGIPILALVELSKFPSGEVGRTPFFVDLAVVLLEHWHHSAPQTESTCTLVKYSICPFERPWKIIEMLVGVSITVR